MNGVMKVSGVILHIKRSSKSIIIKADNSSSELKKKGATNKSKMAYQSNLKSTISLPMIHIQVRV